MFDINKLYEARNDYEFMCDLFDPDTSKSQPKYDIMLWSRTSNNDPDCHINHFGYNFYFRTKAGMDRRKYKSISTCVAAIKRRAKDLGFDAVNFRIYHTTETTVFL